MAQLKDSSDEFKIGAIFMAVALGVGLLAMWDNRNDDEPLPEPPAQKIEIRKQDTSEMTPMSDFSDNEPSRVPMY
jgi:hypothetical protein